MELRLAQGERLDDLQNGYEIIQDESDFCFGIDAVLLAWFARLKKGAQVLDMGSGNGIVPILLAARHQQVHITGLEIQEKSAALARRSVAWNHLDEVIQIVTGDIKEAADLFGKASFSAVTVNPPYMTGGHGLTNDRSSRTIARHEVLCTLEEVIREASLVLEEKGRFYMVHRPFRLAEIFSLMVKYHLEPKRMRLVHPYVDKEPNMVLVEGLKGGNPRITVEKPLIVYREPGIYSDDILQIYGRSDKVS